MSEVLAQDSFGNTKWVAELTGWSLDKVCRLARQGIIPGAYQAQPRTQRSEYTFAKAIFRNWLKSRMS